MYQYFISRNYLDDIKLVKLITTLKRYNCDYSITDDTLYLNFNKNNYNMVNEMCDLNIIDYLQDYQ